MAVKDAQVVHGSINEPVPRLHGRYADLSRRLIEVVRRYGEVRFQDCRYNADPGYSRLLPAISGNLPAR